MILCQFEFNEQFFCSFGGICYYENVENCLSMLLIFCSGLEDGKAEKLLIETFRRHSARAVKQAEEKKRRFEEMDRKKKERAEMERKKDEEDLKKR